MSIIEKNLNLVKLWRLGKNPWVIIPNPFAETQKNKRFIRVRSNDYWGNPKPRKKDLEAAADES